MKYISTRGQAPELTFEEAMLTGLARDGGLYLPAEIPVMSHDEIAALAGLPYEEIAFRVMWPYVSGSFAEDEFKQIIGRAYEGFGHDARAPLKQLNENHTARLMMIVEMVWYLPGLNQICILRGKRGQIDWEIEYKNKTVANKISLTTL